jgi:hypothetical protein
MRFKYKYCLNNSINHVLLFCLIVIFMQSCALHLFDGKSPLICTNKECVKKKWGITRAIIIKQKVTKIQQTKHKKRVVKRNKVKNIGNRINLRTDSLTSDTTILFTEFTSDDFVIDDNNRISNYVKDNKAKIKNITIQPYFESKSESINKRRSKRRGKSVFVFFEKIKISARKISIKKPISELNKVSRVEVLIELK